MSDGNSQTDGQPIHEVSTGGDIMQPIAPGAFGVTITTTDVKAGFGNIETVVLQSPDGSSVFCEHHAIGVMSIPAPTQDVPPGETQARP